jgi:hypothetical protein
MAAYSAFLNCAPRDWLDVLSAVGPTVAAGIAVAVSVWAVSVAKQSTAAAQAGVDLQRSLSNPRLSILERVYPDGGTVEWIVELQNSGISPGSISSFRVFANDKEIEHPLMQSATEFWLAVFMAVGITQIGKLIGDYWRTPTLKAAPPCGWSPLCSSGLARRSRPPCARSAWRSTTRR